MKWKKISLCLFDCLNKSYSTKSYVALRSKKKRSAEYAKDFVDSRLIQAIAGKGGDGCISFLREAGNEYAGPDGGDGGNGGHVLFETSGEIKGLGHVSPVLRADNGEKGYNKDCNGRNAVHKVIKIPVGTVIKNNVGKVIADLKNERMIFVASRAGAGGRGNRFFASDINTTPRIAEYGAEGEKLQYKLELSSIAHFGLLGFPNAGKSTLLKAVTRANPKVAPYPFTTLQPHLGVVKYTDMEQITIADLPGLIEGSHKNLGLGISFLRHAERCMGLIVTLDMTDDKPWKHLYILRNEVLCFSKLLSTRPQIIIANKMDMPNAKENLMKLKKKIPQEKIIPVSAKHGLNLSSLLTSIRIMYDEQLAKKQKQIEEDAQNVEEPFK